MFYLYVKTHNATGLKYLGQTRSKNPHRYRGSGKYWKLHLKKYGNDVTTEIIFSTTDLKELKGMGIYYSTLFNVVESDDWANIKPEEGEGGSPKGTNLGRKHSDKTKQQISLKKSGVPNPKNSIPRTKEQKEYLSKLNRGKKKPRDVVEKIKATKAKNPFKHTEEYKQSLRIPKSDETKAKMKANWHEKRNNIKRIWITDGINNTTVSNNSEIPIGWSVGRNYSPTPPSQKGKFWINNGITNKMSAVIPVGWSKGRLNFKKGNKMS